MILRQLNKALISQMGTDISLVLICGCATLIYFTRQMRSLTPLKDGTFKGKRGDGVCFIIKKKK